uniref:Protein kinase domain-containing protein n=1 Tax=Macrostomum lignano TaxID=282301 RepID=A0A1I8FS29_9PLAT
VVEHAGLRCSSCCRHLRSMPSTAIHRRLEDRRLEVGQSGQRKRRRTLFEGRLRCAAHQRWRVAPVTSAEISGDVEMFVIVRSGGQLLLLLQERQLSRLSRSIRSRRSGSQPAGSGSKVAEAAEFVVIDFAVVERVRRLISLLSGFRRAVLKKANRKQLKLATSGNSAGLRQLATQDGYDLPDKYGPHRADLADPTCADMWSESCLHQRCLERQLCRSLRPAALWSFPSMAQDEQSVSPLMRPPSQRPRQPPPLSVGCCGLRARTWSLEDQLGRTARDLAREKDGMGKAELEALLRGKTGSEPVDLIGRGGFGEVHESSDRYGHQVRRQDSQTCLCTSGTSWILLERKSKALLRARGTCARLRHPNNIVRFLHMAQPEPATVVVFMELLDGRSLERFNGTRAAWRLVRLTDRQYSRESDIWAFGAARSSRWPPAPDPSLTFQQSFKLLCDSKEAEPPLFVTVAPVFELKDFYSQCTARNRIRAQASG